MIIQYIVSIQVPQIFVFVYLSVFILDNTVYSTGL